MGVGISLSGLASAVANQGGIGVISATGLGLLKTLPGKTYRESNILALYSEIQTARAKTKGVLGVNVLAAATDYGDLLLTALEAGIDLIFIGAGLPLHKPREISDDKWLSILSKTVPIISSGRAARLICTYWQRHYNLIPSAFVIEGPLAGGHLGFKKNKIFHPDNHLEKLFIETSLEIRSFEREWNKPISLIPAGGIFDGADIFRFLRLGAQGVQMATRFVGTHECDADISFKQAYIKCEKKDIAIIDSPVGLPGRAIQNEYLVKISQGRMSPVTCFWKCLKTCDYKKAPYCIAEALRNAQLGKFEEGFAFAGETAYRIEKLVSVKELIDSLVQGYTKELQYFKQKTRLLQSSHRRAR
ncbi:nitronate monooxygenase [bacterium]|nr:nitronate monooxygenase [bacterium]